MERATPKTKIRKRPSWAQLQQRVIFLQSEILKYKRKLKRYRDNAKYKSIDELKTERDKLEHMLEDQYKKNEKLEKDYSVLQEENEKMKEEKASLLAEAEKSKENKEKSHHSSNYDLLNEKIGHVSEQLEHYIKNYEKSEKRLKNHDKELAKIELLIGQLEQYSKNKVEEQLMTLKTKISAIEEKIMNESKSSRYLQK
ncbi:hypothetical protein CIB95_01575 [Lottiidibacillus patelloidae]|uniref:Uncharacterized protein n=1 Tax=Lottiidibacillus patelloidae TaxID=2670334 RepID=A0A263BYA2_9BACI|nr:hypothetical protein [Lottiidibacillus patelloidae]OZM58287.1 hypothetical protein CIB95_01575 [Lottiidibacillus patelloidae]